MLEQYVFFGGARVARRDVSPSAVHYYFSDHLGSHSVVENATGTVTEQDIDYYPYGGQENDYSPNVAQHYKFNGKERDTESGLDNFGARYHASALGRFMQTDPVWIKANRILDPQRLNLYAYGRNDPLKFTDPTGMDIKLGSCGSDMTTSMCEAAITDGLNKDDRSHVHFVEGDGKNGYKKGETGILVDKDYKSESRNFTTLQRIANDHNDAAQIDVRNPSDSYSIKANYSLKGAPTKVDVPMGQPSDNNGFLGYTFFPYVPGKIGVWSVGNYTDAVVSTVDDLTKNIYHELQHIVIGDFGRNAFYAGHERPDGKPNPWVDYRTQQAEDEAGTNEKQK
jgi:RHS repeat-associated protein